MLYGVLELFSPIVGLFVYLDLIYSFYEFKEYILRIISFKDIYQIFLNGILLKIAKFCLIAQFLSIFRPEIITPFSFV
jgi:hypothetical protein